MSINLKNKEEIIKKYGKNEKDSGSARVQVALLTQKILELTEHLKINKKDFQGRRGLLKMVGKRKQFLSYIKNKDLEQYRQLISDLKIRG
ncbi:MAG: 30S ribosomal protein S15 [Candidatus Gastranaerophilales bacterium]|nr:30S ribosomal protein S15 [Candidatus Gastranaerophilales bacterium]